MGDAKPLLVVFGAGGGTGLACVERCVQQALRVRAVVRVPDAHRGRMPPDVELVAGDVTDKASIAAALRGAHGVVFAASASSYLGADDVDHKGIAAVGVAAREAGVRRVVLISSALVSPHNYWSPIRLILNTVKWRLMDAKYEGEQKLRRAGVSYTIIRPGRLLHGAGGDAAWVVGQGDAMSGGGGISRADVAALAVAALHDADADCVTLEVMGAQPAAPAVLEQLAAAFKGLQRDAPLAADA